MNTNDLIQPYEELANLLHRRRNPSFMEKVSFLWKTLLKGNLYLFFKTESQAKHLLEERAAKAESNASDQVVSSRNQLSAISGSGERIAVYTALFGRAEKMYEPVLKSERCDYYLITDRTTYQKIAETQTGSENECSLHSEYPQYKGWSVLFMEELVPDVYSDPVRKSRFCKMHPQHFFPEYRYSIYFDANHILLGDVSVLTAGLDEKKCPVATFTHRTRDCVYQEIDRCIAIGKGNRKALRRQEKHLRQIGVPEKYGLLEGGAIARIHHHPDCIRLMDTWWECYMQGSERDQVALVEALWKESIPAKEIGTLGTDFAKSRLFIRTEHWV